MYIITETIYYYIIEYLTITNFKMSKFLIRLAILLFVLQYTISFKFIGNKAIGNKLSLYGKIAPKSINEENQSGSKSPKDTELVTVPFNGLIGSEGVAIFDKPLEIFDPTKEAVDNLPGEDGSDEKINAIMEQIQKKVEDLKSKGTWGEEIEEYGKDPLTNIPLWTTMMMQLKACKPFESVDELALTFTLLVLTTLGLTGYILLMRESFDSFIVWFLDTDFDLISSIIRNKN